MRRVPLVLVLLLLPALLTAQTIPLREIDFTEARISVAGPETFYLRNLGFQGERYAVHLGRDDAGNWTLTDLYAEDTNLAPRDLILDFATIRLEGESTLLLDGIFVDGAVYQGRVRVNDNDRGYLVDGFRPGSLEAVNPERLRELREAILQIAAPEYESRITALEAELSDARSRVAEQEMIVEELLRENDTLEAVLRDREAQITALTDRVAELEERLARASSAEAEERDSRESGLSRLDLRRLEEDVRALREEADGVAEAMRALQGENERLVRENAELEAALRDARERAEELRDGAAPVPSESLPLTSAPPETLHSVEALLDGYRRRLTRRLLDGFENGRARLGSWSVQQDLAVQRSAEEYFSRFALPLEQMRSPTLFAFRGRSLEPEMWTGFGIHLFASDVERPRGYGHGESLLIWFTRDRESYGTDNTYVQVYRSTDDVAMKRVAGGVIPEPITSPLHVEVLYQPDSGDTTVAVNGEVKLLYKGWFGIEEGVEIALRTKGRGRFEDLTVFTVPE